MSTCCTGNSLHRKIFCLQNIPRCGLAKAMLWQPNLQSIIYRLRITLHAVADPEILKKEEGGGGRLCISLVVIHRKCTQRTFNTDKRRLLNKKSEPIVGGGCRPTAPPFESATACMHLFFSMVNLHSPFERCVQ